MAHPVPPRRQVSPEWGNDAKSERPGSANCRRVGHLWCPFVSARSVYRVREASPAEDLPLRRPDLSPGLIAPGKAGPCSYGHRAGNRRATQMPWRGAAGPGSDISAIAGRSSRSSAPRRAGRNQTEATHAVVRAHPLSRRARSPWQCQAQAGNGSLAVVAVVEADGCRRLSVAEASRAWRCLALLDEPAAELSPSGFRVQPPEWLSTVGVVCGVRRPSVPAEAAGRG
jgi:hypothetical protein